MFGRSKYTDDVNTIKNCISTTISRINKRYKCLDMKLINNISHIKNESITVNNKKYTPEELQKLINSNLNEIRKLTKYSSYSDIMSSFIKDIKGKDNKEVILIREKYKNMIEKKYSDAIKLIYFCMDVFSILLKKIKSSELIIEYTNKIEEAYEMKKEKQKVNTIN